MSNTVEMACLRCKRTDVKIYSRGLHQSCYLYILHAIHDGKVTDEEMVEKGWMLPRGAQGRKARAPQINVMKKTEGSGTSIMQNLEEMERLLKETKEQPIELPEPTIPESLVEDANESL